MKKNNKLFSQINDFLKVIADQNRLLILKFLATDEKCVCEIWQYLGLPQNLVSHHLKILKEENLISSKKNGLKVIYKLNEKKLKGNLKLFNKFLSSKGE